VRCLAQIMLDGGEDVLLRRSGTDRRFHAFFLPLPFNFFRNDAK
jgi:hypothetical protein